MNRKYGLISAAILLIILGLLRGSGGMFLLIRRAQLHTDNPIVASNFQIILVGIGLLIVGVLFILAAINLIRNYSHRSWLFSWIVLFISFLDGLINGYLLFGKPLDQGQRINIIAVIVVGIFLFLGKPALKSEQESVTENQKIIEDKSKS
jgi:hypothetical protein